MDEPMDRGSKKWQGLMLPEHIEMLKEAEREQYRKDKPILDEQEWDDIGLKLMEALETGETVRVTYYNDFDFTTISLLLKDVDGQRKVLHGREVGTKESCTLSFSSLIDVQ